MQSAVAEEFACGGLVWLDIRDRMQLYRGSCAFLRVSLRETQRDLGGETLTAKSDHVHEEGLSNIQVWWPHSFLAGHRVNSTSHYTAVVSLCVQGNAGSSQRTLRSPSCPRQCIQVPQGCIFIYTNAWILKKKKIAKCFSQVDKNI